MLVRPRKETEERSRKAKLCREIKDGYLRENEITLQLAREWFHLDDEAEQNEE